MYGASPRYAWAPDFPSGYTDEDTERYIEDVRSRWGSREMAADKIASWMAPNLAGDPGAIDWMMSFLRLGASPGAAIALEVMNQQIDVRSILPAIQVPTLVVHREGDPDIRVPGSYITERIPGSTLVVLPGEDHGPWFGDAEALLGTIESFVKDVRNDEADLDRVLATVLFTDIVGSTGKAAELGDRRWRELLDDHHARSADSSPATAAERSIRPVTASWRRSTGRLGRSGARRGGRGRSEPRHRDPSRPAHGRGELVDETVRGIAVPIGARVGALAGPSEVLVSQTVKDLVAGSGLTFEDAGEHELKGVPDRWHLYRVVPS